MLRRCASTVRGLRKSCWATSRVVAPVETSRAIWSSCVVRASVACAARLRGCSPVARSSLAARPAEGVGAHVGEHPVGGAELVAGFLAASLAAQPLAVDQVCPGAAEHQVVTLEQVERFEVVLLGTGPGGDQGPGTHGQPEAPASAGDARSWSCCSASAPTADGHPDGHDGGSLARPVHQRCRADPCVTGHHPRPAAPSLRLRERRSTASRSARRPTRWLTVVRCFVTRH